jgi:hypothetical protein
MQKPPKQKSGSLRDHHRLPIETCPRCAEEWKRLGAVRVTLLSRLADSAAGAVAAFERGDELPATPADVERQEAVAGVLRRRYTRALEEKSELLRTPAHRRVAKIRHARRRFRSCLLAEMLVEECVARVHGSPAEAAALAYLAQQVLGWAAEWPPDAPPLPRRVPALRARASAHQANALRVVGDLPKADRIFADLRLDEAATPIPPLVRAEIDSLEASLRTDQRRLQEAEILLALLHFPWILCSSIPPQQR